MVTNNLTPIVLDFETYYDDDYSLKKMPTAQYVRDIRFRVLGCAVTLHGQTRWLQGPKLLDTLRSLPWNKLELVAHNAQFDALILTERVKVRPARYTCTMFMLRYLIAQGFLPYDQGQSLKAAAALVGREKGDLDKALASNKLEQYATMDAEICWGLYRKFWRHVPEAEREYIDQHVRMAVEPRFDLDIALLQETAREDAAFEKLFPRLRQDAQFAKVLQNFGITPEYKPTKRGFKLATAKTDRFMKRLIASPDTNVRRMAEMRLRASSTINRTRAQRFLDVGAPLPAPLLYYGAHTGRSSGTDNLNMQNLKHDGALRKAIRAPQGYKLVIGDSSQIEVRVLAWLAGEEKLLDIFRRGIDPYRTFAAESLYNCKFDAVTPEQRQRAKAAVLALGFGQGSNGFMAYCQRFGIDMSLEEAEYIVNVYRSTYTRIKAYWATAERHVREQGFTELPSKRLVRYPNLRMEGTQLTYTKAAIFGAYGKPIDDTLWHGKIVENAVQALARDVVYEQSRLVSADLVLMEHDALVYMVREEMADTCAEMVRGAMSQAPAFTQGLPVKGEVEITETLAK